MFLLFAGAAVVAAVQFAELAAIRRAVGVADALTATALAALLGAFVVSLAALPVAAARRRQRALSERWAVTQVTVAGLLAVAAGGLVHFGGGVRGAPWTPAAAFAGWTALAVAASWTLSGWLVPAPWRGAQRERWTGAAAFALALATVGSLAVGLVRTGAAFGGWACAVVGALALGLAWRYARRQRLWIAAGLWLLALPAHWLTSAPAATGPRQPAPGSIVWIVLDTTRADVHGAYGAKTGDTPAFDRLAGESAAWDEVVSSSPWTVPSHATLFTGLPPRMHDCWHSGRLWLEEELETVAERLAERGWGTAAFYGNDSLRASNLLQGFAAGEFLESPASKLALGWAMRSTGVGIDAWIDRGATRAVAAVDRWLGERRGRRPFFLFVNLFDAHEPYVSPWRERVLPAGVGAIESMVALGRYRPLAWHALGREQGAEEEIVRAAYRSSIRHQDRMLGKLIEAIAGRFELDELSLVVTTDHGENLGDGGRWGHTFTLNEALIHLPLIIRAPGRVKAGERIPGSFSSIHLPATVLDLAGVSAELGLGRSLLHGREADPVTVAESDPFYPTFHLFELDFASSLGDFRWPMTAVRSEGHKLVVWHGGPTRLYDLRRDPQETEDLFAAQPEIARRLLEQLAAWATAVPRIRRAENATEAPRPLDADLAEQLRALGYL